MWLNFNQWNMMCAPSKAQNLPMKNLLIFIFLDTDMKITMKPANSRTFVNLGLHIFHLIPQLEFV